ncbi:venom acid phosphatase Acph-1-like isoform X2 [Vespula maculifrons]|uniref:acid phosphatase n=1 Tax=Vespula maculifrons TaxID=7453 RepID=A0ABD2AZU3_VESMC
MISNQYLYTYSIVLLICISLTFAYAEEEQNLELKLLNVIFRHGDRTPDDNKLERYPNDPYINYDFYPMGRGQLTNNGIVREFKLGEFLRKRYDNYFGKIYTPSIVKARSSDYDRTKASLQLVLAGLFPPKGIQIWNPQLEWQPIPSEYVPKVDDNLFLSDDCPRYLEEYDRVLELSEYKKEFAEFEDLTAELTKLTGKNITTSLNMANLYHSLMAIYSMNLSLPEWAKSIFPYGKLYNATVFAYKTSNYNKSLRKIYGGALLKKFVENMMEYVNGTLKTGRKLFLYSGHETNIASLLYTLNAYTPHIPAYSSSIIMELLYKEGIYYVKVLHYLGIPPELEVVQLPGCEVICPLNKFLQLIINDIPSDKDMVCDKTTTTDYADQKYYPNKNTDLYNIIENYINNKI